ncbi:hypothetical protein [Stenotrophomonas sp. YIM B06876]|nr:hypothetical protein [Stenotrophomonas sp. YIM B06876]
MDAEAGDGPYAPARIHALRGDPCRAFEWLQRDWARGDQVLFEPLLLRFP